LVFVVVVVVVVVAVALVGSLEVVALVGSLEVVAFVVALVGSLEVVEVAVVEVAAFAVAAFAVAVAAFAVAVAAFAVAAFVVGAAAFGAAAAASKTAASAQESNLLKLAAPGPAQEPNRDVAAAKAEAEPDLHDVFLRQKWKRRYSLSKLRSVDINAHDTIFWHYGRIVIAMASWHSYPCTSKSINS
jgi:hypothetical protein